MLRSIRFPLLQRFAILSLGTLFFALPLSRTQAESILYRFDGKAMADGSWQPHFSGEADFHITFEIDSEIPLTREERGQGEFISYEYERTLLALPDKFSDSSEVIKRVWGSVAGQEFTIDNDDIDSFAWRVADDYAGFPQATPQDSFEIGLEAFFSQPGTPSGPSNILLYGVVRGEPGEQFATSSLDGTNLPSESELEFFPLAIQMQRYTPGSSRFGQLLGTISSVEVTVVPEPQSAFLLAAFAVSMSFLPQRRYA